VAQAAGQFEAAHEAPPSMHASRDWLDRSPTRWNDQGRFSPAASRRDRMTIGLSSWAPAAALDLRPGTSPGRPPASGASQAPRQPATTRSCPTQIARPRHARDSEEVPPAASAEGRTPAHRESATNCDGPHSPRPPTARVATPEATARGHFEAPSPLLAGRGWMARHRRHPHDGLHRHSSFRTRPPSSGPPTSAALGSLLRNNPEYAP
jgi:hypothetical protein